MTVADKINLNTHAMTRVRELDSFIHLSDICNYGYSMHAELKWDINQQGVDHWLNYEYIERKVFMEA